MAIHPTSLRCVLSLSFRLRIDLQTGLFQPGFRIKNLLNLPYVCLDTHIMSRNVIKLTKSWSVVLSRPRPVFILGRQGPK